MSIVTMFSFCACISGAASEGRIDAQDGDSVIITADELPNLLLDLAADGGGMPGRAKHHSRVLAEWYARKKAPGRASLRLVG